MRSSTLTHNNAPSQPFRRFAFSKAWRRAILLASALWSVAQAQTNTPILPQSRVLVLNQTQYHVRAGESVEIDAPRDSLDFLVHAKGRRVGTAGFETPGFVFGPNDAGDQILLV